MGTGSMRVRGRDSRQLRMYLSTDPETGRPRWLKTVHGTPSGSPTDSSRTW
jgi:hypothetical protein